VDWVQTDKGNLIPLDPGPEPSGNLVQIQFPPDQPVVRFAIRSDPPEKRRQTHFVTCPEADQWRRR